MAETQAEPFFIALHHLRGRLQAGELAPGARISAVDLADELRLSTTPVREALSRLSGEGLVEDRRGQGYFVPLLNAADVADLYRMSLAHLLIALEPRRPRRLATSPSAEIAIGQPTFDAVGAVEDLFRTWVQATGSRMLMLAFRVIQAQLGPVRRLEQQVFGDLTPEAQALLGLADVGGAERLSALRHFHTVRIREAEHLALLLEAVADPSQQ